MKRVLITGAASGMAAATKVDLEQRGCQVVGLDVNASGDLIGCDVRDQASVDVAVAAGIERLGGLDVLVNCAGLATPQSAGLAPDARAHAVIDVNLMGPWRVTSAALPTLRAARGRVVNVASGMAFAAVPFAPAYAMSKHGIVAYSAALRLEHGDAVSVTTVYPGVVRTPIHRDSEEFGLGLAETAPVESMEAVVSALRRAALGARPARDIVTTMTGRVTIGLSRFAPRPLVDRIILGQLRRSMADRSFVGSPAPVAEFASRLAAGSRKP